jgi:hypothetical protein
MEILMAVDFDFLRHRLGLTSGAGNTSLALLRQRLERAESELESARAAMRSAAAAAGIERAGLFSGSAFISRETGERWADEARREGEKAHRILVDHLLMAQGKDPDVERARIKAEMPARAAAIKADLDRWHAEMTAAGFFDAVEAKDYARAGQILATHYAGVGKGQAIVRAAARARMSADAAGEVPPPPKGSLAARIIAAGARRRTPTGGHQDD